MRLASQVYQRQLWATPSAIAYLQERAVPPEIARRQKIGYADGRSLLPELRRAGRDSQSGRVMLHVAEELGLVIPRANVKGDVVGHREFFFKRVIVPELRNGHPIWFIGRRLDSASANEKMAKSSGEQRKNGKPLERPKYLSLPGPRPVLGLEQVVGKTAVYLVEGPFDWLAAISWRLPSFSVYGSQFPIERLPALSAAVAVYGVFDPDRAGCSAAERFAPLFVDRWRPVRLPNGLDLAELAAIGAEGRKLFGSLVPRARAESWLASRPASTAGGAS
jgi:DNA primase